MRTGEYWKNRVLLMEEAEHRNATKYANEISRVYDAATRDLEKELTKWYTRYANDEGITLTEAKRLLNSRELKEFRMDVHEYIEKGRSLDPQWAKQLERASTRVHISRLEALKVQTQQLAERVKGQVADSFDEFAIKTYSDQYYKTIFEVQKGAGIGFDIMKLDEKQLQKVINIPWATDGKNFSQRIWGDRTKLVNELHQVLSRGIVQGKTLPKLVNDLSERMGVSESATKRLVYTESAFFANQASVDSYNELGVERYEILATLDRRTTPTCRVMDGKVFDLKDRTVSVNYPPFHAYCRTTTVPYFDDEFDIQEKRAARGKDGKYYTVPASMKYKDWLKTFVDGGSKDGLVGVKNLSSLISEVRSLGDNATEDDFKRVGEAFIKEFDLTPFKQFDDDIKRLEDEIKVIEEKRELARKKGINDKDFYKKTYDEWLDKREKIKQLKDEVLNKRASVIRNEISKYRSVGFDKSKLKRHLNVKRWTDSQKQVVEAYQHYPTEWVEKSVDFSDLTIKKVSRGYYRHYEKEIGISGKGFRTAVHELAHRFERTSNLLKFEKQFYDRRTQGEALEWLGRGYKHNELTRKDKFIKPYIGKDYKETAYEVCSVGFELAYTDTNLLLQDKDFAQFIFGLLLAR